MSEIILKDEYSNEEECKLAIAKYNEGKKPEEEMLEQDLLLGLTLR